MSANDCSARMAPGSRRWLISRIKLAANECWEWQLGKGRIGYGQFKIYKNGGSQTFTTHRQSYRVFVGPIPEGLYVCHRCDNPTCINPDHLFVATAKENAHDAMSKGRLKYNTIGNVQDEFKYSRRKLTDEQIVFIKQNKGASTQQSLAKQFGVTRGAIGKIQRGERWACVM